MGIFKGLVITRNGDDLLPEERAAFWDQGVNMDDWDCMILLEDPDSVLEVIAEDVEHDPEEYAWDGVSRKRTFRPKDYDVERLLRGPHYNKWYRATFRGKKYAVGVAYH